MLKVTHFFTSLLLSTVFSFAHASVVEIGVETGYLLCGEEDCSENFSPVKKISIELPDSDDAFAEWTENVKIGDKVLTFSIGVEALSVGDDGRPVLAFEAAQVWSSNEDSEPALIQAIAEKPDHLNVITFDGKLEKEGKNEIQPVFTFGNFSTVSKTLKTRRLRYSKKR